MKDDAFRYAWLFVSTGKKKGKVWLSFIHYQTSQQSSQASVTLTLGSVSMEPSELFSALDRPGPQDKVERERERARFRLRPSSSQVNPLQPPPRLLLARSYLTRVGRESPLMTPVNERKRGINFVFDSFNLHHSCCHCPPPSHLPSLLLLIPLSIVLSRSSHFCPQVWHWRGF